MACLGADTSIITKMMLVADKAFNRLGYLACERRFASDHHRPFPSSLTRALRPRAVASNCDVICARLGSAEVAFVKIDEVIIEYSDLTWKDFAEKIAGGFDSQQRYVELVRDSRSTYEAKLNWDAWARAAVHVFDKAIRGRSASVA